MAALVAATTVFGPAVALPPAPLAFLGLSPGAPRATIEGVLATHRGRWRCQRSAVDARFSECRGTLAPAGEPEFQVTASLVHDSAAVLLLATEAGTTVVDRWTATLSDAYGPPTMQAEQGLVTRQWIRSRRMIRLTSRNTPRHQAVSLSLVDGILLDGLGATSSGPASSSPQASPASSPPPSSLPAGQPWLPPSSPLGPPP